MKQILTFNFRNQLHFRINLFLAFFQFTKLSFKRLNITLRLMAYNKKLKKSDIEKIKLFYEELEMKMQRGQDLGDYADTKLGQIYANSDVHLNDIQVFGFDYDYTIANYTKETNVMTYMEGRNYLVDKMSYPKEIRDFAFNPKFSIVGLHYDIKTGYLLKLTQFSKIQYGTVYYGKQQVSQSKVEEVYPGRRISDIYAAENLKMMSDLFALPVANLISDIIEFFSEQNIEFNSNYLYIDIQNAFDAVHLDKTIHKNISANPEKYIGSSEKFISFVNAIMKSGKKMFMLTNNTHFYVNLGCEKIFAPIVDDPDSGIKHWSEIFDVIIMHSKKPDWYDAKNAFRIYDPVTASLCINTVNTFERGKVSNLILDLLRRKFRRI
ncbi:hypothetical protein MHBO_002149 [Bonamia ostreae]|uniref:5'-nucleotidase n=1 Tax=Bonamia ostreae TaxID=126728 RepID=A0ABV2ALV7_9EUKA